MPDSNDKYGDKLDVITSQIQQMMVDLASIKANNHGDSENIKLRVSSLEAWRESFGRTLVGIFTGIFIAVCAGLFMLMVQGKIHV